MVKGININFGRSKPEKNVDVSSNNTESDDFNVVKQHWERNEIDKKAEPTPIALEMLKEGVKCQRH